MQNERYEKLTYTVVEAAKKIGISRGAAYEACRRHELPVIRIGKRILVSRVALDRLLDVPPGSTKSDEADTC